MSYLIISAIVVVVIFLIIHQTQKIRRKNSIDQIRSQWGLPKKESFHFASIARYSDVVPEKFHRLTDQTIEDIDFHKLFVMIDRTCSKVGQQFLYKKVTEPTNSFENPSEHLIQLFSENKNLREEVQLELQKLDKPDAYFISSLLREGFLLEEPKWFNLVILDAIIIGILTILSFKFPIILMVLLCLTTINMLLHYWNKSNTFQYSRSIPQLNILVNVSKELLKKDKLVYDRNAEESIADLRSFQQKARLMKFGDRGIQDEVSQIANYLLDLIKIYFLIEVVVFFKIMKDLKKRRQSIVTLFNFVGNIDASISIASLRASELKTCQPVFSPAIKKINVKHIYHPLIRDCVKNSLEVNGKSILITGSNMSGKSTFLRTLAINSILAQTIYTCFADEFVSPILKQFSSIRIDDNLFEGKSYYFQEVNIMASLVAEVNSTHQNLFVLDEVFKGTNAVERIAAAKATLSYLNRHDNIVIVSTHDIELAYMLADEYELYHFTEVIDNGALHFDHTIKPGPVRTRNAIKILEMADFPEDIINEARAIITR
jgi:DNA mismatch repair ATPase MutS